MWCRWAARASRRGGFPAEPGASQVPVSNGLSWAVRASPLPARDAVGSSLKYLGLSGNGEEGQGSALCFPSLDGAEWQSDAQGVKRVILRTLQGRSCSSLQDWTSGGVKYSCWVVHLPGSPCDPKCASGGRETFPLLQIGGVPQYIYIYLERDGGQRTRLVHFIIYNQPCTQSP